SAALCSLLMFPLLRTSAIPAHLRRHSAPVPVLASAQAVAKLQPDRWSRRVAAASAASSNNRCSCDLLLAIWLGRFRRAGIPQAPGPGMIPSSVHPKEFVL